MRLNAAEFAALAGAAPAEEALRHYAREQACVVALTGATDEVTDGARLVRIANGDPMMGRVTAMGCAGAAVVAAALAVEPDALAAVAAGAAAVRGGGRGGGRARARAGQPRGRDRRRAVRPRSQDTLRQRGRVT